MSDNAGREAFPISITHPANLLQRVLDLEKENHILKEQLRDLESSLAVSPVNYSEEDAGRFILHGAESHIIDILNLLPDMILVVDLHGKVIAWNQAAENLTGVTASDMLGRGNLEYAIPFYGFRRHLLLNLILDPNIKMDPEYPYLRNRDGILTAENFCPAVGPNGLYIWATAGPLYNSRGQMVGAIELLRDISENRKAHEDLESSEAMYRRIVETAVEGIWMLDEFGLTTFANICMADMLGCTPEEMMGRPVYDFLNDENHNEFTDLFSTIQSNPAKRYGIPLRRADGSQLWAMGACKAIFDREGEYIGALGMFTDISDKIRWDQQMARLDRLNVVGKVAAGIGHEIRNPMTSVRGFLQLLSQQNKYHDDMEYFDIMIEELDRANSIITEFLNIAQSKAVRLESHNINDIIEAVYPLIHAEAVISDKKALLDLRLVNPVLLDEKEIRQLVMNLSRNAMESMQPGGTFVIRTYGDRHEVVMAIEDQGSGIDPTILDRLGTPFFTTKDEGTGLGLAVCYGIATRHQAILEFDSSPKGTIVLIRFQLASA